MWLAIFIIDETNSSTARLSYRQDSRELYARCAVKRQADIQAAVNNVDFSFIQHNRRKWSKDELGRV